jgi:hypothetical protein
MERSRIPWRVLFTCLFIASADAAPAFTNSTTSRVSLQLQMTTTSPPATTTSVDTAATAGLVYLTNFTINALSGTISAPCLPDAGQVCNREGQPTYAYDASPYLNSYYTAGVHD